MDTNSDDDALELPKPKNNKETIDALKSLKKEKQSLPKRPQSEAQKIQFAAAKAVRDENRRLRAEAKELLLKDKQSKAYSNEKKKGFKAKEMEELKLLLNKNKEEEVAEPKQIKKATERKKVIEESESEESFKSESESESEDEKVVIVKKKPKPKAKAKPKDKKKKKVTIYMSSSDDDGSSSDSDYNPPAPKQQKSRVQRPNQEPVAEVPAPINYKSYFV